MPSHDPLNEEISYQEIALTVKMSTKGGVNFFLPT